MNNATVSALSDEIISATYQRLQVYICLSSYTVWIYASLLHFPDEVKYIWKQKFTLPSYLYLLSKYPVLFYSPVIVVQDFVASSSLCNNLGILSQIIAILAFLGIQGMISVRTYALCESYHRPVAAIISVMILISLAALIYGITVPECTTSLSGTFVIFDFIQNIIVGLSDILTFVVVVHRVWGLWKLKRSTRLQDNKDLVTLILEQGTLRFCFTIFLAITQIFLSFFAPAINSNFAIFENIFSSLLICEFTLELRKRDAKKEIPSPSAITLPTISFEESPVQSIMSALGRLHESVVAEMGERNEPVPVDHDSSGSREPDGLQNSEINLV